MIIGNQTKLYYKKKAWLTPKHPLYFEEDEFKEYYAAAVIIQAGKNPEMDPGQNFELDRLLYRGLGMNAIQIGRALRLSAEPAKVMDYFYEHTGRGPRRYLLMMDLYNVCEREGEISTRELENIRLFGRMLDISEEYLNYFSKFIHAAFRDKEVECRSIYQRMDALSLGISLMELKYYLMTLYDTFECRQETLEKQKELHLVDRCEIREDLVLRKGMHLILDHAIVRIYGNIALEGGKLSIDHSRIIRKSGSHRACINIRNAGEVWIRNSSVDCRDYGMFIRAQEGNIRIRECEIYQTTRGAAIRFWGESLMVSKTTFRNCYSPENGGAIMIRGGKAEIQECRFVRCEAVNGGAVYGREELQVQDCTFEQCFASEYGAAVYYEGLIKKHRMKNLNYLGCFPERGQLIQHLSGKYSFDVDREYEIDISTIFDGEIDVMPQGKLYIHDAMIYIRHPIRCRGSLKLERIALQSSEEMTESDMIVLEHARGCSIRDSYLDGNDRYGGIFSSGTRIELDHTSFYNIRGGRAVFNALTPRIIGCTFNYCQNGGIHCQGGLIEDCLFVNCRGKSGAGVTMLGKKGVIENCRFIRCIADISGGAIDRAIGNKVSGCEFIDCRGGDA